MRHQMQMIFAVTENEKRSRYERRVMRAVIGFLVFCAAFDVLFFLAIALGGDDDED